MWSEKRFGGDGNRHRGHLGRSQVESELRVLLRCKIDCWLLLKLYETLADYRERPESHEQGFDSCAEEMDIARHSEWRTVYVGRAIGPSGMKMY